MKETKNNEENRIKKPITFKEQIELLESRNLKVEDKEKALRILSRINYYRLSAYMITFKINDEFKDGITFEKIYELYEFDKRLRNMFIGIL